MQFFLLDLALPFIALLGYRALSLVAGGKPAAVPLDKRVPAHRRTAATHMGIVPQPAPAKTAPEELATPRDAPCSDRCRSTHRLINFW